MQVNFDRRVVFMVFFGVAALLSAFKGLDARGADLPGWEAAAPPERIREDWMQQDHGTDFSICFTSAPDAAIETRMIQRVLAELGESGRALDARLKAIVAQGAPGADSAWSELYFEACEMRRQQRLKKLVGKYPRIIYTKHYNIGGSHYAYTENPTDAQSSERQRSNPDWRMGATLCLMEVKPDGHVVSRTLLEEPDGLIRDPDVSYDGRRVVFSMRDTAYEDDFHLYELDVATGETRQLTWGLGFADVEPSYLPNGDLIFNSTRCMQITDCFWPDVVNLYACDGDGRFLRRLGFDQVHTNYPKVLEDGRVIYTRWDYNDRGQVYPQPLFVMNYDGTRQTEYYGNNSWFPTTILHARGIPGTTKLVAVASGHHSHQRGKLILIDRSRGNQEAQGIQLIAPVRETPAVRIDAYGQDGDQFQYPYPLDTSHFLVTCDPVGSSNRTYVRSYGIFLIDRDGHRELLAWDAEISCNQPVPLAARPVPHLRPSGVDYTKKDGTYYIQNIYAGEGLKIIARGSIKKVRVIALEYRPAGIRCNYSLGPAGGALASTPISVGNGCWDVKRVLGDATVYEDGSAWFRAPARTPVYFQALDEKNRAVQTMRSWSTLQPGENASCVGCHENKERTPELTRSTLALECGPQPLDRFYGPARGFSFEKEIQPILDRHCVSCHFDRTMTVHLERPFEEEDPIAGRAFSLLGDVSNDERAGRGWSDSYLALTGAQFEKPRSAWQGKPNRLVRWITAQSEPTTLPPYYAGSTQSELLDLLENGHAGVPLSRSDLDKIACWIDLGVPYCGDYTEANIWNANEKVEFAYYQDKRDKMREIEDLHLRAYVISQTTNAGGTVELPHFESGGPRAKKAFIEESLRRERPVVGAMAGAENIPRNLACNPRAARGEPTCYPHASSNSEYKSMAAFAAKNAIDGNTNNLGHGPKFPSWGPHKRTDLWWRLEFGRPVEIDRVVLHLRADFPHDRYWHTGAIEFSDGTREPVSLRKTAEPQAFSFDARTVTWIRLTDLVQELPLGWCGLTEVEVWGRDAE
ncbi:MAG: hypothetical protein ACC628_08045 [Pirellulaceae bacterium]